MSETVIIKKALWDEMLAYKKRIEKLETLSQRVDDLQSSYKINLREAKELVFHGAQTHASILRCENDLHVLEKRVEKLESLMADVLLNLEARFVKIEQEIRFINHGSGI